MTSILEHKSRLTIFSVPSCCHIEYKPTLKGADNRTSFINTKLLVSSVIWFKSGDQMTLQDALYFIKTVIF
jgi:hypothetical protein